MSGHGLDATDEYPMGLAEEEPLQDAAIVTLAPAGELFGRLRSVVPHRCLRALALTSCGNPLSSRMSHFLPVAGRSHNPYSYSTPEPPRTVHGRIGILPHIANFPAQG